MPVFKPAYAAHRAYEITPEVLAHLGVHALLLDVDNTLTTHGNPEPDEKILCWLVKMKAAGISLMLLSNNRRVRVEPFAKRLGLLFEASGAKPLPYGYRRCCKRLGVQPKHIAMVGDQIFTDIVGGNLFGMKTILVEPIQIESGLLFLLKRFFEQPLLDHYLREVRAKNKP